MKTIIDLLEALSGYKTYLCALAVVGTGAALKAGLLDFQTAFAMTTVFLGLMGASTRSAIGNGKK